MNLHEIESLAVAAEELGAARIGFARLVPEGRGEVMAADMLSAEEVESAYQVIANLQIKGLKMITRDPIGCLINDGGQSISCGDVAVAGCAAGLSGVSIMPDGTVMPCRRMNFGIGNINEQSLREIWAASPVLNNLRDKSLYTGKCGDCELWDICRGCRAMAYAASKKSGMPDYLADDPQCWKV
jgi:radical SAM protein with 4Fe4S-binding SPASM domain